MKRRDALKNIGFSLGTMVLTPSLVSLLQSCTGSISWTPRFFSPAQAGLLEKTIDLILPKTELPGGKALHIPQFLDGYVSAVMNTTEQDFLRKSLAAFEKITLQASRKENIEALDLDDIDRQLFSLLKADSPSKAAWERELQDYDADKDAPVSETALAYAFISQCRDRAATAYRMSEYIGEQVLAYDPIPGMQKGCVDLQTTTGGKAWSL